MSSNEKVDIKTVASNVAALVLIVLGLWILDDFLGQHLEKNALFSLGFLVICGLTAGRICSLIGLPSLTGYLAAGLICGTSVTGIIDDDQVSQLRLVNGLALALIAMHAGCEFTNEMLKKNLRSLLHATWAHVVIIGVGVTTCIVLMSQYVDFLKDLSTFSLVSVAALFSAIAISKSPGAVVAILAETKLRNQLSEHALGIVVILDVLVLILFSIVLAFAKASLDVHSPFSLSGLSHLINEIIASVAAGTFFGLLIATYFRFVNKELVLFILAISYGVTALCEYLHYDTLLVFVIAGYIVTNFSRQSAKMVTTIESLSSVVMIVFFATAGASLHIHDLIGVWPLVLMIFICRFAFTWLAEKTAHTLADSPVALKKYGYTPFVSQAGLSIGLSMIVYERLPGLGAKLAMLAISVVTLNEIIGPVLFKWGLNKAEKLKKSPNEVGHSEEPAVRA